MKVDGVLILGMLIAAGCEAAAHWFPWHKILGHPLKPPWTYVVGILILGIPFTLIHALDGRPWQAVLDAGMIVGSGGGMVLLGYAIDSLIELKHQKDDWRDKATYGQER